MFMFPMIMNGNHWVLFVADRNRKRLTFYDPMGGPAGPKSSEIIRHIKKWMLDKYVFENADPPLDINLWEIISDPGYPTQKDTDSCGILYCMSCTTWKMVFHQKFTQNDIPVLRKRALLFLHEKSIK